MKAVCLALLEITVTSAVLLGALLLFQKLLRRQLSAAMKYGLWFLLVLRLMVPVTIESGIHLPVYRLPQSVVAGANAAGGGQPQTHEKPPSSQTVPGVEVPIVGMPVSDVAAPQATAPDTVAVSPIPQAKQAPAPHGWDIYALLVAVWLAGAAAHGLYLLRLRLRLGRQLRGESSAVPPAIEALVQDCKRSLGISAPIRIAMQGTIRSPALAVSLRPILLLNPEILRRFGERELRYSITHELMHYRRRDPWVCLLMNTLRSIHWFNPFVWISFRQMRIDMETACDAMVVRHMNNGEKKQYAAAILAMFAGDGPAGQLTLGMAVLNSRATAERRIRGIYLRKKTRAGARCLAGLLAAALFFACFTTGCQPQATIAAPENTVSPPATAAPLATPRQIGASTSPSPATPQPTATPSYKAPQSYKESFLTKDGKVLVNVDAAVQVPAAKKFPVVEVEPTDISLDMVKSATQVLMEGQPVYEPHLLYSKPELDKEIKATQDYLAHTKYPKSDTADMFRRRLKNLQELYKAAPAVYSPKPADIVFHPETYYDDPIYAKDNIGSTWLKSQAESAKNSSLHLLAKLPGGLYSSLAADNGRTKYTLWHMLSFSSSTKKSTYPYDDGPDASFDENTPALTIPTGKAIEMANQTLHQLGISDMALSSFSITLSQRLFLGPEVKKALADGKSMTVDEILNHSLVNEKDGSASSAAGKKALSYSLTYRRIYQGVPANPWNNHTSLVPRTKRLIPEFNPESISFTITDSGVSSFCWNNPMKETQVISEDNKLLPFDQIMQIFRQQVAAQYDLGKVSQYSTENADYKEYIKRLDKGFLNISDISLGMARVEIKGQPGKYQMVPAWNFHGANTVRAKTVKKTDEEMLDTARRWLDHGQSYLTINAIDGSLITEETNG